MTERIHKTAFGPVNAAVLERLRRSFETHRLLDAVDQMDRLVELIADSSFREDLLRLHAMANTIINDAPKTISSSKEKIWELAGFVGDGVGREGGRSRRHLQTSRPTGGTGSRVGRARRRRRDS